MRWEDLPTKCQECQGRNEGCPAQNGLASCCWEAYQSDNEDVNMIRKGEL